MRSRKALTKPQQDAAVPCERHVDNDAALPPQSNDESVVIHGRGEATSDVCIASGAKTKDSGNILHHEAAVYDKRLLEQIDDNSNGLHSKKVKKTNERYRRADIQPTKFVGSYVHLAPSNSDENVDEEDDDEDGGVRFETAEESQAYLKLLLYNLLRRCASAVERQCSMATICSCDAKHGRLRMTRKNGFRECLTHSRNRVSGGTRSDLLIFNCFTMYMNRLRFLAFEDIFAAPCVC